jgi:CheY-like chemotaxis protein
MRSSRGNFDAIVTDARVPRLTGIELVRPLHQSGSYTPVIIFVSGFVGLTLPDAYDLGVETVLSKPCPRKELVNTLRRSIQRRNLVFDSDEDVPPPAR